MTDTAPVSGTAAAMAVLAVLVEHRDDMESGDYGEVLWSGCICGDEHPYDKHDQHAADQIVARLAAAGLIADPDATEAAAAQARREALDEVERELIKRDKGADGALTIVRAVRDTAEPEETP